MRKVARIDKKVDLLILLVINILAVVVSFLFNANYMTSTLLFLGLPSIYLCLREKKQLWKVLAATVTFGIFLSFSLNFLGELNLAWTFGDRLWFGKLFNVVHIDVILWSFFWVLHVILFYEHFIDRQKFKGVISKWGIITLLVSIALLITLLLVYRYSPQTLLLPKAYLIICLTISIPFAVTFILKPKIVLHTLKLIPYFFFVYLSHEITALKLSQWSFPGDYLGFVHILNVSIPIEELIFWITLSALIGSIYYEKTFDNSRN